MRRSGCACRRSDGQGHGVRQRSGTQKMAMARGLAHRSCRQSPVPLSRRRESPFPALAHQIKKDGAGNFPLRPLAATMGEGYFATTVMVPTILGWMEQIYL